MKSDQEGRNLIIIGTYIKLTSQVIIPYIIYECMDVTWLSVKICFKWIQFKEFLNI